MAEWSAGSNRRLIMNVQETSEIRELTAGELDGVAGGLFWGWLMGPLYGAAAVALGAGLLGAGLVAHADHHDD
jgi:hypothetical protein